MNASRSSPRSQIGALRPPLITCSAPAASWMRISSASPRRKLRTSSSSLSRYCDHRVAGVVDGHPAVAMVAGEVDERRAPSPGEHPLLVVAAGQPWRGRREQPGRRLRRLDEEAVAVTEVRELVRDRRLRRAPPPALIVRVDAGHRPGRVESQVLAHRGAPDPRAKQQRGRLDRAARDDDDWARGPRPGLRAVRSAPAPDRSSAPRPPSARPPSRRIRSARQLGTQVGAVVVRIDQVGLLGRELRAGLVAEAHVAGALRVVGVAIGVSDREPEVVARGAHTPRRSRSWTGFRSLQASLASRRARTASR